MLVEIETGAGWRAIDLLSLLDAADEERAHEEAYAWIKAIRHLHVDGEPFRSRFTYRGDSLWWFAEIYLHKERAIDAAMRLLRGVEILVEREGPRALRVPGGRHAAVVTQAAAARGLPCDGPAWASAAGASIRLDVRAAGVARSLGPDHPAGVDGLLRARVLAVVVGVHRRAGFAAVRISLVGDIGVLRARVVAVVHVAGTDRAGNLVRRTGVHGAAGSDSGADHTRGRQEGRRAHRRACRDVGRQTGQGGRHAGRQARPRGRPDAG